MKTIKLFAIATLASMFSLTLPGQNFKLNPRYSYYSSEKQGEMLLVLPEEETGTQIMLRMSLDDLIVFEGDTVSPGRLLKIPIPLADLAFGNHSVKASVTLSGKTTGLESILVKLVPKSNGVKIDRLTGRLIVNDLPWFPFGFYCYSPVLPTFAEEESVKGFNLMSPYQTIHPGTRDERDAYMDRCARLGMKVHFQLISIAGGGGVGSSRTAGLSGKEKLSRLKAEIEHFRNHPALLAWYLSDEPTGNGVSADSLQGIYDFVRALDPYHPITIVFDAPQRAREYSGCMDIVMADPYPIPAAGVDGVGSVTESLTNFFRYEKPVWIVPQAFGGGEWWGREPSPQELRAMTYLALVRGATGIQYFIRQGLNGFPKSNVTWGECSKVAMEIQELTPYLLEGIPLPELNPENEGVWTRGWRFGDEILIMAVNTKNEPRQIKIDLPDSQDVEFVEVLFENRRIQPVEKQLADWIAPLGAQVYRIGTVSRITRPGNLLSDPGFESNLSFGVPANCYAHVGSDRGAAAFLDSRTRVQGYHSLRLVTPEYQKGMGLSFFPVSLNSGQSYRFSIFAKADTTSWMPGRKPSFFQKLFGKKVLEPRDFRIRIGGLADHSFAPSAEWLPYTFYFTVPGNSDGQVKVNPYLELTGQGIAWFDEMTLAADPTIAFSIDPQKKRPEIRLLTGTADAVIRYNLEGRMPRTLDPEYIDPVVVRKTVSVAAGIFLHSELLSWTVQKFAIHLAVGHAPIYEKKYASAYSAGGPLGLVDGQYGSRNYLDGRWQGFNGQDLRAIIDLDSIQTVRKVSLGFLQDISAWIFMPLTVEVEGSVDGVTFRSLGSVENQTDEHLRGAIRKDFVAKFSPQSVRYLRIKAKNRIYCPDWHNGKGKAAFIFTDEISAE